MSLLHIRWGSVSTSMYVDLAAAETDAAYSAFVAFGKGSGHPANLNFGDLFAYALAKTRGLPLLYKGDDFAQTDLLSAVSSKRP